MHSRVPAESMAPAHEATECTAATAAAGVNHRGGTWATWGRPRRRLVALTAATWLAVGVATTLLFVLDDLRVLVVVVALLAVDIWLGRRLRAVETAGRAAATSDDGVVTPEEQWLIDRIAVSKDDRDADLFVLGELLDGNPVLRRYEYPTRELLVLRSGWELVELTGIMLVATTAPAAAGLALGGTLWVLGGRSGARVTRRILGQRLYRTPVDDRTRERWLALEHRLTTSVVALALLIAIARIV